EHVRHAALEAISVHNRVLRVAVILYDTGNAREKEGSCTHARVNVSNVELRTRDEDSVVRPKTNGSSCRSLLTKRCGAVVLRDLDFLVGGELCRGVIWLVEEAR